MSWFSDLFSPPAPKPDLSVYEPLRAPVTPEPPVPTGQPESRYDFRTPETARHSTRMICDEEGLPFDKTENIDGRFYSPKDVICAVIMGESGFYNYLPSGKPVTHVNYRADDSVGSTDWGICQINDRYHIGPHSDFPSVDFVMANPDAAVRWMVKMYKLGHLDWWCAFSNGSFKSHL